MQIRMELAEMARTLNYMQKLAVLVGMFCSYHQLFFLIVAKQTTLCWNVSKQFHARLESYDFLFA